MLIIVHTLLPFNRQNALNSIPFFGKADPARLCRQNHPFEKRIGWAKKKGGVLMRAVWKRLLQKIKNICLVDRLLFLFMGMFYLYIGVHLLTGAISLDHAHPTDVIVRTSAAAIFGYFISANFSPSNTAARTISQTPEPQSLSKNPQQICRFSKTKLVFKQKRNRRICKPIISSNRFHFGRLRTAASRCSCRIRIDIFFSPAVCQASARAKRKFNRYHLPAAGLCLSEHRLFGQL